MRTSLALCALLISGSAQALSGNDRLVLTLNGDLTTEGWFYRSDGAVVVLSGGNRFLEVPVPLITAATVNGVPVELEELRADLQAAAAVFAPTVAVPGPGVVTAASLVWAGAGPAMLGHWDRAAGLSLVELSVVGAATLAIHKGGGAGVLLPLSGLEVLLRVVTVDEVRRESRRRRGEVPLRPPDIVLDGPAPLHRE